MFHKASNSKGEMSYCFPRSSIKFQGHTVQNITDFDPNWAFPDYRPVAAFKSLRFALFKYNRGLILTGDDDHKLPKRQILWILVLVVWMDDIILPICYLLYILSGNIELLVVMVEKK